MSDICINKVIIGDVIVYGGRHRYRVINIFNSDVFNETANAILLRIGDMSCTEFHITLNKRDISKIIKAPHIGDHYKK